MAEIKGKTVAELAGALQQTIDFFKERLGEQQQSVETIREEVGRRLNEQRQANVQLGQDLANRLDQQQKAIDQLRQEQQDFFGEWKINL